jgi:hypothetical protein
MSAAALTPRIRIMAVCDEAIRSEIEDEVFTLEGVRQDLSASSFPCLHSLSLYLLLLSARKGTWSGKVEVIDFDETRILRHTKFTVAFPQDNGWLPLVVDLGECVFPEAGQYAVKGFLSTRSGAEALKGELPFLVLDQSE